MKKCTLECEVVTPLFLAGADGRTPELRAASLKGAMRFWWRAIQAEENTDNLRKNEAKIFGGVEEGEGKSSFLLKVSENCLNGLQINDQRPLPHSTERRKQFSLPSYVRGTVSIELLQRKKVIDIEMLKKVLYISLLLGGLGKRSRRGFGSLQVCSWNFTNQQDCLNKILCWLNKIKNDFNINNSGIVRQNNNRCDYTWIEWIRIGSSFPNAQALLRSIGLASHNNADPSLGSASPRMASPVYVSTVRIGQQYHPVITKLYESYPANYQRRNYNRQKAFIEALQ